MTSIWFKNQYVEPILSGDKVDTIRRGRKLYVPGTILRASVGPRPPFAMLEVIECELITLATCLPERRASLRSLYHGLSCDEILTQVLFRLLR